MEITLRKGLQMKKTLSGDLAKIRVKISKYNSQHEDKVSSHICVPTLISEAEQILVKLISLKTAITQANVAIYPKIIKADELKSEIAFYEALSTDEVVDQFRPGVGSVSVKCVVGVNETEKQKKIKSLKADLEAVLDDIDYFNGSTKIKVEI